MKNFLSAVLLTAMILAGCNKTKKEDRTYEVNNVTSVAEWKGSAPDHFHIGSFAVDGAVTTSADGTINEGKFFIPISSIQDFDLPDPVRQQLLDHLKSPDFFNMVLYPSAGFEIIKTEVYTGQTGINGANTLVTGNFTLIGQTHPITFPAKIIYAGDSLKVTASLKIDRTQWGMTKYSGPASAEYIIPDADISLNIQAAKH